MRVSVKLRTCLVVLLCQLLLITLAACQPDSTPTPPQPSPTATETPIPSATIDWFPPTLTPTLKYSTATPNPLSDLTPPAAGEILFTDDFSNESQWEASSSPAGNVAFGENNLSLAVAGGEADLTSLSTQTLPSEFYLEITVDVEMCSAGDYFGLIFWRFSEMGTYRLLINCGGEIRLERAIFDDTSVLQDWVLARRFQPGAPAQNRLGIWATGDTLHFFVNDTYQFSQPVRANLSGVMGLYAKAAGNQAVTVVFSDLIVYQPQP